MKTLAIKTLISGKSAIFFAFVSSTSQAAQLLKCEGFAGPLLPAQASVLLDQAPEGTERVKIALTNPKFPNGISGTLSAQYDPSTKELAAKGNVGPEYLSIHMEKGATPGVRAILTIYGDRDIDYGFGAGFLCR